MNVRQILMTPDLAKKIMGQGGPKRATTQYLKAAIAKHLAEGTFVSEAAGPVVLAGNLESGDYHLLDGWHRLEATVMSGVSWQCVLIEDAPEDALPYFDTGKKRTFADLLKLRDVRDQYNIAAVTRLYWFYDQGLMETRNKYTSSRIYKKPDHLQLWEFYISHKEQLHAAIEMGRSIERVGADTGIARSVACVGAAVLADLGSDEAEDFYRQLRQQGEVSGQVAALLKSMRNLRKAGTQGVYGDQQHQLALMFKAWNFWQRGVDIQYVVWKIGGSKPEKFPYPIAPLPGEVIESPEEPGESNAA